MNYSILRATGACVATLWLGATALAADVTALTFSGNNDQAIVTLSRTHGMVRGVIDKPLLYVFADGRVKVDRPAYMVRPGTYEFHLPAEQLAQLLASMDDAGVLKLDPQAMTAQRNDQARAQRNASGEEFFTTDSTLTIIDFAFASFSRNGNDAAPLENQIQFPNVQIEAERYKGVDALVALAAAEKQLLALMDHPAMKATGGQSND